MILQVKEYNRKAYTRYKEAIAKYNGDGGFPFLPMYLFINEETQEPKQKGWVVSNGKSHQWYKNEQLAIDNQ